MALALSALLAGIVLCWFAAGAVADGMGARELRQSFDARHQLAEQVAAGMASQITADVALLRAVPLTLAEVESIPAGVARVDTRRWNLMDEGLRVREAMAHPEVQAACTFLNAANGNLGLDYTWVVDTRGYVVLASNAGRPGSFIGVQSRSSRT